MNWMSAHETHLQVDHQDAAATRVECTSWGYLYSLHGETTCTNAQDSNSRPKSSHQICTLKCEQLGMTCDMSETHSTSDVAWAHSELCAKGDSTEPHRRWCSFWLKEWIWKMGKTWACITPLAPKWFSWMTAIAQAHTCARWTLTIN